MALVARPIRAHVTDGCAGSGQTSASGHSELRGSGASSRNTYRTFCNAGGCSSVTLGAFYGSDASPSGQFQRSANGSAASEDSVQQIAASLKATCLPQRQCQPHHAPPSRSPFLCVRCNERLVSLGMHQLLGYNDSYCYSALRPRGKSLAATNDAPARDGNSKACAHKTMARPLHTTAQASKLPIKIVKSTRRRGGAPSRLRQLSIKRWAAHKQI